MQKYPIILILSFCILAVSCGGVQKERALQEALTKALATKQYSPELLDAAIDYQDKDTLVMALNLAIEQCEPAKADTIVSQAMKRFHNLSAEKSRNGRKTSMKRVKALVAQTYIQRGDTTRAMAYLNASFRDTIPSNNPAVKELAQEGRDVADLFLAHSDIHDAIGTYIENINTCNSMIIALAQAKDYKRQLKSNLLTLLLVLVIIGIVVFALFLVDRMRNKHQDDEEEYRSVITSLQESTDSYEQMLTSLESQQTDNRREVEMLHRQIEKIQDTMMQRMQTGKIIYETLLRGEPMPYTYKDADSYLIDYVMIFCPEKYKRWQQEYDKLTPRAFTYLILSDMGHDDRKIQEILSISASSVRSIKSRLNARKNRISPPKD